MLIDYTQIGTNRARSGSIGLSNMSACSRRFFKLSMGSK